MQQYVPTASVFEDALFFAEYIFFFKQKTAYEIMPSLVGSEMCIRDSRNMARGGACLRAQPSLLCTAAPPLLPTKDARPISTVTPTPRGHT